MIKTVLEITCDFCYKDLSKTPGYAIIGNIHVISTNESENSLLSPRLFRGVGGGLVGNNLDGDSDVVVNTSHYCKECLFRILTSYD